MKSKLYNTERKTQFPFFLLGLSDVFVENMLQDDEDAQTWPETPSEAFTLETPRAVSSR